MSTLNYQIIYVYLDSWLTDSVFFQRTIYKTIAQAETQRRLTEREYEIVENYTGRNYSVLDLMQNSLMLVLR